MNAGDHIAMLTADLADWLKDAAGRRSPEEVHALSLALVALDRARDEVQEAKEARERYADVRRHVVTAEELSDLRDDDA